MYNELYETWKQELDNAKPIILSIDFYARIMDYRKRLKEEERMLDNKTVKKALIRKEMQHVDRMLQVLLCMRRNKIAKIAVRRRKIPEGELTSDEQTFFSGLSFTSDVFWSFVEGVRKGQVSGYSGQKHAKTVIRILRDIPSIIGADMETYGPYTTEDVASVPADNAEIMIKQSLAREVCANWL